jgi:hypothetical protein
MDPTHPLPFPIVPLDGTTEPESVRIQIVDFDQLRDDHEEWSTVTQVSIRSCIKAHAAPCPLHGDYRIFFFQGEALSSHETITEACRNIHGTESLLKFIMNYSSDLQHRTAE